jgi:hypothetical protein
VLVVSHRADRTCVLTAFRTGSGSGGFAGKAAREARRVISQSDGERTGTVYGDALDEGAEPSPPQPSRSHLASDAAPDNFEDAAGDWRGLVMDVDAGGDGALGSDGVLTGAAPAPKRTSRPSVARWRPARNTGGRGGATGRPSSMAAP